MNPIKDIFNEFINTRSGIEMSISEVKESLKPYKDNILLYGAGSSGIAFLYDLKKIDVTPKFFVDSNPKKVYSTCEGVEIISPEDIKKRISGEFIVIVCINTDGKRYCKSFDDALRIGGHHAVYDRLHDAGCKKVIDYTFFRRCFSLFSDEKYNAPSVSDVDLMLEHQSDIEQVYGLLSDDLSKETFEKIVRFRLLDDSIEIPTLTQDTQYFESGLYDVKDDAVFVDCGAYNGISARTFLQMQKGKFNGYYGVEPDPENFKKLEKYIYSLPSRTVEKMKIFQLALWRETCEKKMYTLDGPGSFIADDIGLTTVKTTTIDILMNGEKATYIKMNIEGSEQQALMGAKKTIETYKPELAIAGYHKTDDLWEIPLMMMKMRGDYKIDLRSYMNHMSFVFYGR